MMETLPLLLVPCPTHARIVHLDDAGRALDRARILLGGACEELLSAAHLAPGADELAGRVELLKAEVVRAWERLPAPELPLI
jgi:hypothetical protein